MSDFYSNMYNPDVLTCLANLSNDEVFTPPEVANRMLDMLPKELWHDSSATFLDPACKSGVFLREIAKRLIEGLQEEIPDLSIPISKIPDISTKIAASTLRFRLLSLVFALIRQNKGKLFLFTHRLLCPAVLRRSVLLPLSRVRRYSSWYSHPHVPEAPVRPLAVRRSTAGCL